MSSKFYRSYSTQRKSCCISKSMTKDQQNLDWRSNLPLCSIDYQKCRFVHSLFKDIAPPKCVHYCVWSSRFEHWKWCPISFKLVPLLRLFFWSSQNCTPIILRCLIKENDQTNPHIPYVLPPSCLLLIMGVGSLLPTRTCVHQPWLSPNTTGLYLVILSILFRISTMHQKGHALIEIHRNNIWLRSQSHMTSHYTWGSVTTLHA